MPEWMASSTQYWMFGLSAIGSISLGCALVAGRNRVPRPAAGNTALRTLASIFYSVVRRGAQRQAFLVVLYAAKRAAIPTSAAHQIRNRPLLSCGDVKV